jgi:predicted extracellular nuclease
MKKQLLFGWVFLIAAPLAWGQVTLSTISTRYTQNFDGIGASLPDGWTVRTGATATVLGSAATLTTAHTNWNNTTGAFKNFASANTPDAATQSISTDRALGVRQTGTFGDPGAAFVVQLANTANLTGLKLSFKLQSLDAASLRTTTWQVDYGIGGNPTNFTTVATLPVNLVTGNNSFSNTDVTVDFGDVLNNITENVWIRIVTLASTSGTSSRASTGIDDVSLTYSNADASLTLSVDNVTVTEGNAGTTTANFTVSLNKPAPAGGVTFDIATVAGTAGAGSDYVAKSLAGQTIPAGSQTYTFAVIVNGDTEVEPDETFTVIVTNVTGATTAKNTATATITNDDVAPVTITPIYAIQGSGATSPLAGQTVTTRGVVVGDFQGSTNLNGFFIQDATGDNNSATSDGIFVFAPNSQDVSVGQTVQITATVQEFSGQTQLSTLTNLTVQGAGTVTPVSLSLPVSSTGLLEQYEGMLVSFPQVLTVSQNFTLARFGEVWLSANLDEPFNEADGRLYNPTNFVDPTDNPASGVTNADNNKAAVTAQQDLNNRAAILLDDASTVQNPATVPYLGPDFTLRVGSTVNNLTGVINFGFSYYRVQPTQAPAFTYAPRPVNPPSTGEANVKIASFNVLNYFNGDGNGSGFPTPRGATNATEFGRQRTKIIAALKALNADVVGLLEMENDGDGANSAIADLIRGLNEATAAGTYDYIRDPANGGTGTDEIKVAFIYKPGTVTPQGAARVDFNAVHNRPPLAQTFTVTETGEVLTAVINHFKSKGGTGTGADADQGDGQGAFNFTRVQQARALANFINNTVIPATGDGDVIVLGDLNAYTEEDPIDVLRAAGFVNLFGPESYSYVFDRQSGSLDHALVTSGLQAQFTQGGKWHINADEPIFLDYNTEFKTAAQVANFYQPGPFRSSDHDPVLVGFRFNAPPSLGSIGDTTVTAGTLLTFTIKATDPENQALSYSIAGGIQDGMQLDAKTGKFTWTPTDAQTGTFGLTFRVTDGGTPARTDQETITITVREKTAVQFSSASASVGEGSGNYTVELTFSAPLEREEQVSISLTNGAGLAYGTDYTVNGLASRPDPLTLKVPAGSTSASFAVNVQEDNADELNEVLTLALTQTSSGLRIGTSDAFALTIIDNDVPAVRFAIAGVTREEGMGAYPVAINADVAPAADLPVQVTINEGVNVTYGPGRDYVTNPAGLSRTLTVTIPAGQQSASFTVTPLQDNVKEKVAETVTFSLAAPGANAPYVVKGQSTFAFNIIDAKADKVKTAAFSVWPNPTSGDVTLGSVSVADSGQLFNVTVRSGTGELLYAGRGTLAQMSTAVSDRLRGSRTGFYLVQVAGIDRFQLINVLKH